MNQALNWVELPDLIIKEGTFTPVTRSLTAVRVETVWQRSSEWDFVK
jgi:hypothetical protein